MDARNPYAAPHTNVTRADDPNEYGKIKVFSANGRIGRVRYIGYSTGLGLLAFFVFAVVIGITAASVPELAGGVAIVGYLAMLVVMYAFFILLSIQRAHDMNSTGWLSLIIFVPLAVFAFWFVPGTPGENDYGKPPPPNSTGAILLACLPLPMLFLVGILAAISIPAYQDYSIRAQVTEGLNLAAGPKAAVVETFGRYETAPADRVDAGLSADATDTAGQYVDGVDVTNGTVIVTYGGNANELLVGKALALQPYVLADKSVVWRCGHAAPPDGAVAMDGSVTSAAATQIEARWLPTACRP
jgi:uncharacterized membrane protein YhaH (DUF805 family)